MNPHRSLVIGKGSAGARHHQVLKDYFGSDSEVLHLGSREFDTMLKESGGKVPSFMEGQKFDAVVVSSPASRHLSHAKALYESSKVLLVEKPLCIDETEAFEFAQLDCRQQKISVCYVLRARRSFRHFQNALNRKGLNQVEMIRIRAHSFLPDWRPGRNFRDSVSINPHLGGGVLLELSHEIDYAAFLFGKFSIESASLIFSDSLGGIVETAARFDGVTEYGSKIEFSLDFCSNHSERWCEVTWKSGQVLRWDLLSDSVKSSSASSILSESLYPEDINAIWRRQLRLGLKRPFRGDLKAVPSVHSSGWVIATIRKIREAALRQDE